MDDGNACAPAGWRNYLFEYDFKGQVWQFELKAADEEEAEKRARCLSGARLRGETYTTRIVKSSKSSVLDLYNAKPAPKSLLQRLVSKVRRKK